MDRGQEVSEQLPIDDLVWVQLVRPTLTSLVKNKAVTDRDIVIYLLLRSMANYSTGEIRLTKTNLAEIFDLDKQKVARAISSLKNAGYVHSRTIKGKNSYMCIDTATLSKREVQWSYVPKKFGGISEELKKMKKSGDLTTSPLIQIGQLNVQINIDNRSSSSEMTNEQKSVMLDLEKKGLLPKILADKLYTYQN
jgi:DNA-binding transcriptional ArsR family regulator